MRNTVAARLLSVAALFAGTLSTSSAQTSTERASPAATPAVGQEAELPKTRPASVLNAVAWPQPTPQDKDHARVRLSTGTDVTVKIDSQPPQSTAVVRIKPTGNYTLTLMDDPSRLSIINAKVDQPHDYDVADNGKGWKELVDVSILEPWEVPPGVRCVLESGPVVWFPHVTSAAKASSLPAADPASNGRIHVIRQGGMANRLWWFYLFCDDVPIVHTRPSTVCSFQVPSGPRSINMNVAKAPVQLTVAPGTDRYFHIVAHRGMSPHFELKEISKAEFEAESARLKRLEPARIDPRFR